MAELTYLQAISDGLRTEMRRDKRVFVIGEDVGVYGGAFKVTLGFQEEFGPWRVIDAPLSETAIVGGAIASSSRVRRSERARISSIAASTASGSGTAADRGSAEGSAEPPPAAITCPKWSRRYASPLRRSSTIARRRSSARLRAVTSVVTPR